MVSVQSVQGVVSVMEDPNAGKVALSADPGGQAVSTVFSYLPTRHPAVRFSWFSNPDQGIAVMYVYGVAPPSATAFMISPGSATSAVADGLFVAAVEGATDQDTQGYAWSFQDAAHDIVLSGTGGL